MTPVELFSYPNNPERANQKAGQKLFSLVNKVLKKDHPVLLLLSGGTWIPALDESTLLGLELNPYLNKLTIATLDERVDYKPENNNFNKLLSSKNINTLIKLGANVINTVPKNDEDPFSFGDRINKSLKNYLFNYPQAILIATAGVGGLDNTLGHIAGIEPIEDIKEFTEKFLDSQKMYCGYTAKKLFPEARATATFTLLDKVNYFVLLILNPEQKRQSLNLILSDDKVNLNIAPCVYFRNRANTTIFTDIPE
jgi:6-phosphogluconolactonase/glucosamine-6-phosphate isomerase/deaminase